MFGEPIFLDGLEGLPADEAADRVRRWLRYMGSLADESEVQLGEELIRRAREAQRLREVVAFVLPCYLRLLRETGRDATQSQVVRKMRELLTLGED